MDKYMKMSDYFVGDMLPDDIVILDGGVATIIYTSEEAAAHAINSHDELVAEVERLRGENRDLNQTIDRLNCKIDKINTKLSTSDQWISTGHY